ncbi:jasmonate-induced oxygenase 2-like [Malania oleifera]|uniref:jasmonate-induced oxygenase 2-like n=1 Tax=Malania oleifera TaxID=397392 RepID=UPI0025ADC85A|nr:jasmonate-induced oxygenase 2-like [Malania oleifera]
MGEVDPAFIQDLEHRPSPKFIEAGGIPLIDLSAANSPDALSNPSAIAGLVAEIGEACENWGFFQVINHGVPAEIRERIENAAREFFAQPAEEKRKVRKDERRALGYCATEHTKNVRDWKEVFDFISKVPTVIPASHEADDRELKELVNQWPEYPPDLRDVCEEYGGEMEKLAFKLLGLISLSLGLPADRLNGFFEDHTAFMRLNHYPPCQAPHLALGIGRHKDSGALTVLAQDDVGGLEVKRKADGVWVFAKPTPDAYIINVGDIVQVWSNDRYESVEHRVKVNPDRERFSIPYFLNPSQHVNVQPLKELTSEENPAKYEEYNWGKFFANRKRSNSKKLNVENIQIYHFKKQEQSI